MAATSAGHLERVVLLVNTRSRRGARLLPRAEALLRERGVPLAAVRAVHDPSRLDDEVRGVLALAPTTLVLGSGDGTFATVVDHIAGTGVVLGYLPLGTTNNTGRSLGLPLRLRAAVDVVMSGHVVEVDVGRANGDVFANLASFGVSVTVADTTPHLLKRRLGRAAYALTAARALRTHPPFEAVVTVDGVPHRIRTHQLNIANGAVHAGARIAHDASIDDGLLVVYRLGGVSPWSTGVASLVQALTPQLTLARKRYLTGRHVLVETDPPLPVELDGETVTRTPLDVRVERNALRVLVPRSVRDT